MWLKEIPGYEGLYGITIRGHGWNYLSERFLELKLDPNGFYVIGLYKDGVRKNYLVHHLVMATWGDLDLDDTRIVVHHI